MSVVEMLWVLGASFFIMAAACYLLLMTSGPLEKVGRRLGHLLHLPEDVIASTFQALATSGPEIVMAILAAFVVGANAADTAEKGASGCLNMCFSAMANLLGIGSLGMIYMMLKKMVKPDDSIEVAPSVIIGLGFYIVSSTCLCVFVLDSAITVIEAWILMGIGIAFVVMQFFMPAVLKIVNSFASGPSAKREAGGDEPEQQGDPRDEDKPLPTTFFGWLGDLAGNGFVYAFLVFALVVFVQQCLWATFNMATLKIVSIGGILCLFTSYVSSFPEFMMTYRYAKAAKKSALLGMLFGSNVIDLAFAGYRAIHLGQPMKVVTGGTHGYLLPYYLWCLPVLAVLSLLALWRGRFKYKWAYPLVVFYLIYVISGFILL